MNPITYARLDAGNFHEHSLDDFCRHQDVTECWRLIQGEWRLIPHAFVETWTVRECREIAADIIQHRGRELSGFGAFDGERVVGFATVAHALFGQTARYVDLACFHVSEAYRRRGIGRVLFGMACAEARRLGAQKLYISAHSSRESQAAYRALGCVHAKEVNTRLAALEPCDVQMEYALEGNGANQRGGHMNQRKGPWRPAKRRRRGCKQEDKEDGSPNGTGSEAAQLFGRTGKADGLSGQAENENVRAAVFGAAL